jgi:hypothetical protein
VISQGEADSAQHGVDSYPAPAVARQCPAEPGLAFFGRQNAVTGIRCDPQIGTRVDQAVGLGGVTRR